MNLCVCMYIIMWEFLENLRKTIMGISESLAHVSKRKTQIDDLERFYQACLRRIRNINWQSPTADIIVFQ